MPYRNGVDARNFLNKGSIVEVRPNGSRRARQLASDILAVLRNWTRNPLNLGYTNRTKIKWKESDTWLTRKLVQVGIYLPECHFNPYPLAQNLAEKIAQRF